MKKYIAAIVLGLVLLPSASFAATTTSPTRDELLQQLITLLLQEIEILRHQLVVQSEAAAGNQSLGAVTEITSQPSTKASMELNVPVRISANPSIGKDAVTVDVDVQGIPEGTEVHVEASSLDSKRTFLVANRDIEDGALQCQNAKNKSGTFVICTKYVGFSFPNDELGASIKVTVGDREVSLNVDARNLSTATIAP